MSGFDQFSPRAEPMELARSLAFHLRYGAWAKDDQRLMSLARDNAPALDTVEWLRPVTAEQVELVEALLLKAIDSDWSYEVSALTGREPAEFATALDQFRTDRVEA